MIKGDRRASTRLCALHRRFAQAHIKGLIRYNLRASCRPRAHGIVVDSNGLLRPTLSWITIIAGILLLVIITSSGSERQAHRVNSFLGSSRSNVIQAVDNGADVTHR